MSELKEAWEQYLRDDDEAALKDAINRFGMPPPVNAEFPFAHRIKDINLNGQYFRIIRTADPEETIYIIECPTPALETKGISYSLKGEELRQWVERTRQAEQQEENEWQEMPDTTAPTVAAKVEMAILGMFLLGILGLIVGEELGGAPSMPTASLLGVAGALGGAILGYWRGAEAVQYLRAKGWLG